MRNLTLEKCKAMLFEILDGVDNDRFFEVMEGAGALDFDEHGGIVGVEYDEMGMMVDPDWFKKVAFKMIVDAARNTCAPRMKASISYLDFDHR